MHLFCLVLGRRGGKNSDVSLAPILLDADGKTVAVFGEEDLSSPDYPGWPCACLPSHKPNTL